MLRVARGPAGGGHITLTRATYGQRAVQLSIVTTARLTGLSYSAWEILCGKMDNEEGEEVLSSSRYAHGRSGRSQNVFPFL